MARLTERDLVAFEACAEWEAAQADVQALTREVRRLRALLCLAYEGIHQAMYAPARHPLPAQDYHELESEVEAIRAEARAAREGE